MRIVLTNEQQRDHMWIIGTFKSKNSDGEMFQLDGAPHSEEVH